MSPNTPAASPQPLNRREFIRQTALAGTCLLGFPAILRSASPNSMLHVAAIGVGGNGRRTMPSIASHPKVKFVALCDVDRRCLDAAAEEYTDTSQHIDWRELFNSHSVKFDAVTICSPDHMHAAPAVAALRAGKHLYLQKPMAGTLHECRVVTREAAKAGVVTQLGTQRRSSIEERLAGALLRRGTIGKVKEVIVWENKNLHWWPKVTDPGTMADPVPDGFDWDLWLGVREECPYRDNAYHPKSWRAWLDFGVGNMGDMGCHHLDTTFDALNLKAPLRVRQMTSGATGRLWGKERVLEMIFPGSDDTVDSTLKVTWYDGTLSPDTSRITLPKGIQELPQSGTYWIGERGSIFKNFRGGRPFVLPEEDFPPQIYPRDVRGQDHYHDWVDAIFDGRKAIADFDYSGRLSEMVLVGAMADRFAGQWLEWDSESMRFANNPRATALVRRTYRAGWTVPGLG